jgi:ABC-type sugar transport system ATPase subunit
VATVSFDTVTKVFPGHTTALDRLTLMVEDGEFLILLGPSGCGKTTALRLIAGLEKPTSGTISIGGRVINDLPPRERDIAMVFQSYALYPHMTVYKNLAFGLRERRVAKAEIDVRVREMSRMLGLDDLLKRKPGQLSGGQRQRVAMGRALVRQPKAFLLDEPLSNLDAKLRVQMRSELKRLHQSLGITTIYVTHDQTEAMTLGDRIAVMSGGELLQVGRPNEVYSRPANLFVAAFIGSPSMNLLLANARDGVVEAGDFRLQMPGVRDGELVLGFRPERMRPSALNGRATTELLVEVVEPLGSEVLVHGSINGRPLTTSPAEEEEAGLATSTSEKRARIVSRFEASEQPRVGERVTISVDVKDAYVFDPASGAALLG